MAAPALVRPRERLLALAAVAVVQAALGLALLTGLRVDMGRARETVERLIAIDLAEPPPPPPPTVQPKRHAAPAPKAQATPPGGSPGPQPARALPTVTPVVRLPAAAAPSGGGTGAGAAAGSGSGGGSGGQGDGGDGGGTDLVQIAGEITSRDYPRDLREAGIGGRVGVLFTVGADGRVTRCSVTRSSGAPELDQLTCRLIQQRFRYRPSTDRYGRPIADEVDGEHDWIAR